MVGSFGSRVVSSRRADALSGGIALMLYGKEDMVSGVIASNVRSTADTMSPVGRVGEHFVGRTGLEGVAAFDELQRPDFEQLPDCSPDLPNRLIRAAGDVCL